MRRFSAVLDSVMTKVGLAAREEGIPAAAAARTVALADLLAEPQPATGHRGWTGFRFTAKPPAPEAKASAAAFLLPAALKEMPKLPEWEAAALQAAAGKWLVRREGQPGYQAMDDKSFREFERSVAAAGGVVNTVRIDDDKVVMTRHAAGKLDGIFPEAPAMKVLYKNGSEKSVYAREGKVLAQPVQLELENVARVDAAAFADVEAALLARAYKDSMGGLMGQTMQDGKLATVNRWFDDRFRPGDVVLVRKADLQTDDLLQDAFGALQPYIAATHYIVHSFRTGENFSIKPGDFDMLPRPHGVEPGFEGPRAPADSWKVPASWDEVDPDATVRLRM